MNFGKMEIVNCLAAIHGHKTFLEISTGTTGLKYSGVNSNLFTTINRLSYNVTSDFDDGFDINFRSDTCDISRCVAAIENQGLKYDAVFVDPYHDYASSLRDIKTAYRLLNDGGSIVVHDCLPPHNGDLIAPDFVEGNWCGVTFIAYVDFILDNDVQFETVHCDYGCGVIHKRKRNDLQNPLMRQAWMEARKDAETAFLFLHQNAHELLHLVSPNDFLNSTLVSFRTSRQQADAASSQELLTSQRRTLKSTLRALKTRLNS